MYLRPARSMVGAGCESQLISSVLIPMSLDLGLSEMPDHLNRRDKRIDPPDDSARTTYRNIVKSDSSSISQLNRSLMPNTYNVFDRVSARGGDSNRKHQTQRSICKHRHLCYEVAQPRHVNQCSRYQGGIVAGQISIDNTVLTLW